MQKIIGNSATHDRKPNSLSIRTPLMKNADPAGHRHSDGHFGKCPTEKSFIPLRHRKAFAQQRREVCTRLECVPLPLPAASMPRSAQSRSGHPEDWPRDAGPGDPRALRILEGHCKVAGQGLVRAGSHRQLFTSPSCTEIPISRRSSLTLRASSPESLAVRRIAGSVCAERGSSISSPRGWI